MARTGALPCARLLDHFWARTISRGLAYPQSRICWPVVVAKKWTSYYERVSWYRLISAGLQSFDSLGPEVKRARHLLNSAKSVEL